MRRIRTLIVVILIGAAAFYAGIRHWTPQDLLNMVPSQQLAQTGSAVDAQGDVSSVAVTHPSDLPDSLKGDFETICASLDRGELDVQVAAASEGDISQLVDAVRTTPEYFWVSGNTSYTSIGLFSVIHFTEKYDDVEKKKVAVETVTANAMTSISPNMSDYEKSVVLHDWLCQHVTYAESTDGSDQDIYGALVNGRCVCSGYALAYCHLMREAGLSCMEVAGTFDGASHAWDRVTLDGETYYTDVTGDDQEGMAPLRNWLNLTSEQMGRSHVPTSASQMPESMATTDNWYVRNGLVLDSFDVNSLADALSRQDGDTLDVMCANEETFDALVSFIDSGDVYDVLERSGHPSVDCRVVTTGWSYGMRIIV